jgi:hypothetical protein
LQVCAERPHCRPEVLGRGVSDAPAPRSPLEIHDLVAGGDSGALRKTIAELRDKAFFIRPVEKLREKLHRVKGRLSENHDPDETPASAR